MPRSTVATPRWMEGSRLPWSMTWLHLGKAVTCGTHRLRGRYCRLSITALRPNQVPANSAGPDCIETRFHRSAHPIDGSYNLAGAFSQLHGLRTDLSSYPKWDNCAHTNRVYSYEVHDWKCRGRNSSGANSYRRHGCAWCERKTGFSLVRSQSCGHSIQPRGCEAICFGSASWILSCIAQASS